MCVAAAMDVGNKLGLKRLLESMSFHFGDPGLSGTITALSRYKFDHDVSSCTTTYLTDLKRHYVIW